MLAPLLGDLDSFHVGVLIATQVVIIVVLSKIHVVTFLSSFPFKSGELSKFRKKRITFYIVFLLLSLCLSESLM